MHKAAFTPFPTDCNYKHRDGNKSELLGMCDIYSVSQLTKKIYTAIRKLLANQLLANMAASST